MKNLSGNTEWVTETTEGNKTFTWRAKTEKAWKDNQSGKADFLNWEEWVCVGVTFQIK